MAWFFTTFVKRRKPSNIAICIGPTAAVVAKAVVSNNLDTDYVHPYFS